MSRWKPQWDRVRRYEERLEEMERQVLFNRRAISFCDDLFTFFVECHSFKDWLINDDSILTELAWDKKERLIEKFVHSSFALQLCADIANGKKHLKLGQRVKEGPDRGRRKRRKTQVKALKAGVTPEFILSIEVVLQHDGEESVFDCSPSNEVRASNRERLREALRESPDRHLTGFEKILTEAKPDDQSGWESAAENADVVRQDLLNNGFCADQIYLVVLADVDAGLPSYKREDPMSDYFDRGVASLASCCRLEWSGFLDRHVPGWQG